MMEVNVHVTVSRLQRFWKPAVQLTFPPLEGGTILHICFQRISSAFVSGDEKDLQLTFKMRSIVLQVWTQKKRCGLC